MPSTLGLITYLTDDYDRTIAWFTTMLDFTLLEDTDMGDGKRWVRMAPHPGAETGFLIARATTPDQVAAIGKQSGDRVGFFLHVDDFAATAARLRRHGVSFRDPPRQESYRNVAVFLDRHGNAWDLIEPA